jgi:hypothetical protein
MALNPVDLSNDLKAAFSNSPDPAIKALTDAFYVQLAVCINTHIKRGSVAAVTVNLNTGVQIAPVLIT